MSQMAEWTGSPRLRARSLRRSERFGEPAIVAETRFCAKYYKRTAVCQPNAGVRAVLSGAAEGGGVPPANRKVDRCIITRLGAPALPGSAKPRSALMQGRRQCTMVRSLAYMGDWRLLGGGE